MNKRNKTAANINWELLFPNADDREKVRLAVDNVKLSSARMDQVHYQFSKDGVEWPKTYTKYACFAAFWNERKKNKYFRYKPEKEKSLDNKKCREWIALGYKKGLLPFNKDDDAPDSKQSWESISKYGWIVKVAETEITEAQLYVALTYLRFLSDEASVVNLCLNLMSLGVSFWQAFMYAHNRCLHHTGHSFLNLGVYYSTYGKAQSLASIRDIGLTRRFRAFCRGMDVGSKKIDNRTVNYGWTATSLITNKKGGPYIKYAEALLSPILTPIVTAPSIKHAKDLVLALPPEQQAIFEEDSINKIKAEKVVTDVQESVSS